MRGDVGFWRVFCLIMCGIGGIVCNKGVILK